ncbi:MAG: YigZ family protein [Sulfurospirillaceae bacterium]|nr:YigZ family protein [Sulfurospirillaceae bacterium]
MQSVKDEFNEQIEIKKSSFIAYLIPISDFETIHARLKVEHPKARHIVWAKRYLNEFDQIVENSSDDGEPKGTSGPPVLNVMRGAELIECGILIVRYFGGIKLGTGGLVRAYGSIAKNVIESARLLPYEKKENVRFYTVYNLVSRFEHFFENENISFPKRAYLGEGIEWEVSLSESEKDLFLDFALQFERDGFRQI